MSISVEIHKKLDTFDLDVSFHSTSRRIGILGASGCGKSMTLKSIAGIETPDDGKITVEGRTLFDKKEKMNLKPQKRNVGYLFQNYALFPTMTVEKNIAAGLKESRQENAARVRQMVEKFQLGGLEKRLPGQLSGGQQQRVAIGRALVMRPMLVLADEPTGNLDSRSSRDVMDLLCKASRHYQQTVLMITHNMNLTASVDRVMKVSDGVLTEMGGVRR